MSFSEIFLLTIVSFISSSRSYGVRPRVWFGRNDTENKYPYVVSIECRFDEDINPNDTRNYRCCTGSAIAATWVLTAAHCLISQKQIVRFGDVTVPLDVEADLHRNIKKKIRHPRYRIILQGEAIRYCIHDIGLILTSDLPSPYASINAADFVTLPGLPVEYAGYGKTYNKNDVDNITAAEIEHNTMPLQIGDGVVLLCENEHSWMPLICVSPKCINKRETSLPGDSGGPLFFKDKIIGVMGGSHKVYPTAFVPVSPYLDWIHNVMTGNHSLQLN